MVNGGTEHGLPGGHAESPLAIPPRGWWQVIRRAAIESGVDNLPIIAGGVAFFAFVAVFPAIIAALTVYGLIADPVHVADQVEDLTSALPPPARDLIIEQLMSIAKSSGGAVTVGLMLSMLLALGTASVGTSNMVRAVNVAYDEDESRGFIRRRLFALGLTFVGIIFVLLVLALIAVAPTVLAQLGIGDIGRTLLQILRWTLMVAVILIGLVVLYRVAPDRRPPRIRWVVPGAVVATVLWLVGGVAFSLYVQWFGTYNKTYGALAGVIVLMLGLWLASYAALLGAEVNAEAERQTSRDSTTGRPRRMGDRGATAADSQAGPTGR